MTKRYAVIQKKLEQLESELKDVINFPAETTPFHQLVSESVERRFSFLRSFLTAEIETHPSKPHHLYHMDQRLAELETAFHEWDNFTTFSPTNHIDTASTCSCTESCLNDDVGEDITDMSGGGGGGGELTVYENPEFVFEDEKKEEVDTGFEKVQLGGTEGKKLFWRGKFHGFMRWAVMFGLGLLGFILGYINYECCSCCYKEVIEMEYFLPPT
ncbi:hypothetical protein FRX31_013131 [Thalictrum thalictroides]|uniref:DUF7610 domain-containing protein n=1 Tax=Thalictrum thalictroides TaxID=46969 RepID=A0A7J6WK16_THATH|nr:hypothetical protein FRX31_013131 [Thalictrum thalictroides]